MPSLTDLGMRHTRMTILAMIVVLALGALTYTGFPKREDPAITVRTAIVSASNPGLTPEQLEELVALPLEEAARAVTGVDEVRTQLTGGNAVLQVDIANAVPEAELGAVFDEIRDDMQSVARSMPDGTRGPLVNTSFGDVAIASIAITGEGFIAAELEDAAHDLRDRLYAFDTLSAVDVHGVQPERVWLEIDRDRLATLGTALDPVIRALQTQNVSLASGSIDADGMRVPLETSGAFASLDEIGDTLVELPAGLVRVRDLVDVRRGTASPIERPVYLNGEPAVLVTAEMAAGEDIVAVGTQLREAVAAFEADQPIGIQTHVATFQPDVVEESVNAALLNVVQTFLVVLAVMLVFLGARQAMVIATIVPFTIAFALAGMSVLGVELQQVSIAAVIISLGLLVDNGLVIVEDMDRRIRAGSERREAATAAGRQYAVPLMIASTTTVAAFLPLFLLDGTEGQYGFSLGAVVGLMLLGSFLSAVYILPLLALWLLPNPKPNPRRGVFDHLADGYAWVVRGCVRVPLLTLLLVVGCIALGVSQMGAVRQQLFPLSERAQFLVYLDAPKGTDIETTRTHALRIADWLDDEAANPEVRNTALFVGHGGPRFVLTLDPADTDPASAFAIVNTTDFAASTTVMKRLDRWAAAELPAVELRLKRLAMGGREPVVDVEIAGPDADRLLAAAYEVEAAFASAPGLVQNRNDWGARHLAGRIVVAQDRAREYGLSTQTVSEALSSFFDGLTVSHFREGDALIPIVLRGAPGFRDGYDDLANAAIEVDGEIVALDQIATIEPRLELSILRRVDQRRTVTVSAISDAVTSFELADHITPTVERLRAELGPAYTVGMGGEIENSGEVRAKLGAGLPAALIVMLGALTIQFNSFRRVAVTLLTVPLVVAGVPLALNGFGQPLSFFGTLGLIALSGIVINNAIVMIDQIDIERETLPLKDAIVEGARKRFRPILLTSLTTVLGLVPMALTGGALWEPVATLMIGGLGVASLLALFHVPALYALMFRTRKARPVPKAWDTRRTTTSLHSVGLAPIPRHRALVVQIG